MAPQTHSKCVVTARSRVRCSHPPPSLRSMLGLAPRTDLKSAVTGRPVRGSMPPCSSKLSGTWQVCRRYEIDDYVRYAPRRSLDPVAGFKSQPPAHVSLPSNRQTNRFHEPSSLLEKWRPKPRTASLHEPCCSGCSIARRCRTNALLCCPCGPESSEVWSLRSRRTVEQ